MEVYLPDCKLHILKIGGHTDGNFTLCKPGVIISRNDVRIHDDHFTDWDVYYLPETVNTIRKFTTEKDAHLENITWLAKKATDNYVILLINGYLNGLDKWMKLCLILT